VPFDQRAAELALGAREFEAVLLEHCRART
jgi:hypothetical protein